MKSCSQVSPFLCITSACTSRLLPQSSPLHTAGSVTSTQQKQIVATKKVPCAKLQQFCLEASCCHSRSHISHDIVHSKRWRRGLAHDFTCSVWICGSEQQDDMKVFHTVQLAISLTPAAVAEQNMCLIMKALGGVLWLLKGLCRDHPIINTSHVAAQ